MKRHNALNEQLLDAVRDSDTALVQSLLDQGADPNAMNKQGSTPLHWAAFNGDVDTARLLIDKGADITAKNKEGQRPIDIAPEEVFRALQELFRRAAPLPDRQPGRG